mmetsp:Transcript_23664/g.56488  ORF Transcript_23664/g.56488 Transcript_23664/m.56488 type:complete len:222 (-) Transcript_23664:696-1361(-)
MADKHKHGIAPCSISWLDFICIKELFTPGDTSNKPSTELSSVDSTLHVARMVILNESGPLSGSLKSDQLTLRTEEEVVYTGPSTKFRSPIRTCIRPFVGLVQSTVTPFDSAIRVSSPYSTSNPEKYLRPFSKLVEGNQQRTNTICCSPFVEDVVRLTTHSSLSLAMLKLKGSDPRAQRMLQNSPQFSTTAVAASPLELPETSLSSSTASPSTIETIRGGSC